MLPYTIFYIGIAICCVAITSAIIGALLFNFYKKKLNRQLDLEYGKRRN